MCDPVGRSIAGRAPGVHLSAEGVAQVETLCRALVPIVIAAVYTSPLERARETAAALARGRSVVVRDEPGLIEVDFGEWTGHALAELDAQPLWRAFNERREATRIPGGETMGEVTARAWESLHAMQRAHPEELIVAVSHGDVIRALLASCLGLPVDNMLRFEVAPASVSTIEVGEQHSRVLSINWRPVAPV
jgi:probable phosphoglycerate mutase